VIKVPGQPLFIRDLPGDAVLEVSLCHPDFDWFAELCLKWHAVPAVSDMALVTDQTRHTAAPFRGHYMGTEIGARNLGDERRYNLLATIATHMGLDLSNRTNLWKDRALIELNTAVLHSFHLAGVTIVDHHTASLQFMQHIEAEARKGRDVNGDWSWLVPPLSGSSCPVFHRYYDTSEFQPGFVHLAPAWLD
jgi:nitric-oxide synthase